MGTDPTAVRLNELIFNLHLPPARVLGFINIGRQLIDTNLNIISGKIKIFGFKHDTSATAHVIYVS